MKVTAVLAYLVNEMKEDGLIRYDKDFLQYVGVPHDLVSPKQLSGFLKRAGNIYNKEFLKKIECYFNINTDVWTSNEERQKSIVNAAIRNEVRLKTLPNEDALNISSIILTELPCSKDQLGFLNDFFHLRNTVDEEKMIDKFLTLGLLERQIANQEFLVRLIKLTYDKGLYRIIKEFILPNLIDYHNNLDVQKIEAHTYGSLGKYHDAKHILGILIDKNTIENINLRTSALSNYKRELLQSKEKVNKEDLYILVQGYQDLYALQGIYNYYTGINLLYMTVLGQILFSDDKKFISINLKEIYEHSKHSLKKDETHNDYYASMSKFEFLLLLEREGTLERIESFLENTKPHISLVERTVRQMELFVSATKNNQNAIVKLLQCTINLLESYIKLTKKHPSTS